MMDSRRWLRRFLVVLAALVVLALVGLALLRWVYLGPFPDLPLPAGAKDLACRTRLFGFYRQCSFQVHEPYPSLSAVHFYGAWLEGRGWVRMTPAEDGLVTNGWQRFEDGTIKPMRFVDQYFACWRSPNGRLLARVFIRYDETVQEEPQTKALVVFLVEPAWSSIPPLGRTRE